MGGNSLPSSISCAEDSKLIILGDFELGPGVYINLGKGATLILKGKKKLDGKLDYLQHQNHG